MHIFVINNTIFIVQNLCCMLQKNHKIFKTRLLKGLFIILLLIFFPILTKASTDYNITIDNLKNELPNYEVVRLLQDSNGFIWIGTTRGLYRYDGNTVKAFKTTNTGFQLLTNNYITALKEDSRGHIFVGTNKGLNILNKLTGKKIQSKVKIFEEIYISDIVEMNDHKIWIGANSGLYEYDLTTDSCTRLLSLTVKGLLLDSKGDVWVGTWSQGLQRFDKTLKKWITYPQMNAKNSAHVIFEDSHHRIWIGSFGCGLALLHNPYDIEKVSWTTFVSENDGKGIIDNYIYAISENKVTGTIWIGTRGGLSFSPVLFEENQPRWTNLLPRKQTGALAVNEVDALINDKQGNIWIGTLGGGVYQIRTRNLGFYSDYLKNLYTTFQSNTVRSILVDREKNIWMGIGANGLAVYNSQTQNFSIAKHINSFDKEETFVRINQIFQSSASDYKLLATQNGLYVATLDANNHLSFEEIRNSYNSGPVFQIVEDPRKGYFFSTRSYIGFVGYDLKGIKKIWQKKKRNFSTLLLDKDNNLWTGSVSDGVLRLKLNPDSLTINESKVYNVSNGLLPSSSILYLYKDSRNQLWAATDGAGLCKYIPEKDCFVSLDKYIHFPTDLVTSIVEDANYTLWLGTNIGLIQFYPNEDLAKCKLRLYSKNDGLADNVFMARSVSRTESDELYFGTHNGYVYFHPSQIKLPQEEGEVLITDVKLDNHSILSMDSLQREGICPLSPEYADKVTIPYHFSNFSFEFSPMTYSDPEKVRYAYKLIGYDNKWIYTDFNRKFAYYSHVLDGNYVFQIKATNDYGQWNENFIKKISVKVLPPFWRTWWAYLIYTSILVLLIIYLYQSAKLRLKLKTEIRIKQIEQEKQEELNKAKLRFFTNITHELFTPITIISAATEEVKSILPVKKYEIITANTNRLIRLIQQILEFRKSETGNLKLKVSKRNIYQFILKKIEYFLPLMDQKHIQIQFECEHKEQLAYFDSDKVDKILYNLLSNALKYNKEGNKVLVTLCYSSDFNHARLSVEDNGEGLSDNAMHHVFERFYDGEFRKYNTTGTGIGLSLVNDLVKLHKGKIKIDNHPGEGVGFIIEFPIVRTAYTDEECNEIQVEQDTPQVVSSVQKDCIAGDVLSTENEKLDIDCSSKREYSLLIVEDNLDLLSLLESVLSPFYVVFTATNGKIALDILKTENIHLIVSDVMMPEMDGYELCRCVKEDIEINHIPLILLTAKVEDNDAVEGYESGADAYMTKPFSVHRLLARVNNLLKQRAQNISEFKKQQVFEPKALKYSNRDEQFIQSVLSLVNQHYANSEFDQNQLAEMLALSRSTLHRKLTSLIGMTAANLIKDVRMKNAKEMISKQNGILISEVAYAVGFNDPKYFSMCFKKEFGILPSEYVTNKAQK